MFWQPNLNGGTFTPEIISFLFCYLVQIQNECISAYSLNIVIWGFIEVPIFFYSVN